MNPRSPVPPELIRSSPYANPESTAAQVPADRSPAQLAAERTYKREYMRRARERQKAGGQQRVNWSLKRRAPTPPVPPTSP